MIQGSCLCKGVAFQVLSFKPHTTNCHCSMCRKFHGAAFATYAVADKDNLQILSGQSLIKKFTADNSSIRHFCKQCGSSLFFEDNINAVDIDIALGVMDSEISEKPEANIYTESTPSWSIISDILPKFPKNHNLD